MKISIVLIFALIGLTSANLYLNVKYRDIFEGDAPLN